MTVCSCIIEAKSVNRESAVLFSTPELVSENTNWGYVVGFGMVADQHTFSCPEDISTYTDLNSCTSLITSGLNIEDPDKAIKTLSWEMTGATIENSPATGVNQINSYIFNEGTTVITYRGEDGYNNSIFCTFTVTVADNQVPSLENPQENIVVAADLGDCSARVSWSEPMVTDNCANPNHLLISSTYYSGSAFAVGTTEIEYTISDGVAYNELKHEFSITVTDEEAPEIIAPEPIDLRCGDPVPDAFTSWQQFTNAGGMAYDNCNVDYNSFRYLKQKSSSIHCPYSITRTYQISDTHGNISEVEHLIYVGEEEIVEEPAVKEEPVILKSGMATIVSTAIGGDWNDPNTWVGGVVPTVGDDVEIVAGATVTLTSNESCDNILINGTLTVSSSFKLDMHGNWINNGTFNAGSGSIEFTGTANATISGSSNTSFNQFILNKGTDVTSELEISSVGTVSLGSYTFTSGLLKLTSGTYNLASAFNIPEQAGIHVNGATLATGDFSINNRGLIRITSGTANFGNSTGNSIITLVDGAFELSGGVVNIAGRFDNSAGGTLVAGVSSGINITGGTINLATVGHGESGTGALNVTAQGAFSFTGGLISIENGTSTSGTAIDLSIADVLGQGSKTITNGIFQLGAGSTSGETFVISSLIPIPNIQTGNNANLQLANDLVITNQYVLNGSSRVDLNGSTITIPVASSGNYTFFGNGSSNPITVNFTGGTFSSNASLSITIYDQKHPNNQNVNYFLDRYWLVTTNGITNPQYSIDATFSGGDVNYSTSDRLAAYYEGGVWNEIAGATITGNTVSFNGNSTSLSFSVLAEPTVDITNPNPEVICDGGSVTFTTSATGGSSLNYSWVSSPVTTIASVASPTVSPPTNPSGTVTNYTYTVTVTDANGFTATDNTQVTVNPLHTISLSSAAGSNNQIVCYNTAIINISYLVGGGASSASITSGVLPAGLSTNMAGNTFSISGAPTESGTFNLQITTSGNSCTAEVENITLTVREPLTQPGVSSNQEICYNTVPETFVGTAASGGSGPLSYQWQRSANGTSGWTDISGATSLVYTPLALTSTTYYRLVATDTGSPSCGAEYSSVLEVDVAPELTVTESHTDIVCNGGVSEVTLSATGGTAPYSYIFNGITDTDGVIQNVVAGTYNWSVTDARNCTPVTGSLTINQPDVITASTSVVPISCNGESGQVTINASGGTPPYQYSFNNSAYQSGNSFSASAGNNYSWKVRDANGCEFINGAPVALTEPTALTASAIASDVICNGENTGSIELTVSGGTPNYSFNWDNGAGTSEDPANLVANTYSVTVTDNNGCTASASATVNEPTALTASISQTSQILCNGGDGAVLINASGGTGAYTFHFEGEVSNNTGTFAAIGVGGYDWSVEDAAGCIFTGGTFTIAEPVAISIDNIGSNSDICEGETLNLTSSASGGTGTLRYDWTGPNGFTANNSQNPTIVNASSAASGTYTLTVTDVNSCSESTMVDVIVHATPTMDAVTDQTVCDNTNTLDIVFAGADSYTWTNDNTSIGLAASGTGSSIGSFTATNTSTAPIVATIEVVPTTNGCVGTPQTFSITVNPIPEVEVNNNAPILCDNGVTSIVLTSNVAGTSYQWVATRTSGGTSGFFDGNGSLIEQTLSGAGEVDYTITPVANGCTGTSVTVTIEVISSQYDLEVVPVGTNPATVCSGYDFNLSFSGNSGSGVSGGWYQTEWEWVTQFLWTNSNVNIGLVASGGPLTDPGSISFTTQNNTNEDQTATITITPWSYYRSRSRWFWESWPAWGAWQQLCSGESYSVVITVHPFLVQCPIDYSVNSDPGSCTASISTDNPTFDCSPNLLTWEMVKDASTIASSVGTGINYVGTYAFETGVTTINYYAEDADGNSTTCSYTVTVTDDEDPQITCPADINVDVDPGNCSAVVAYTAPVGTDNCATGLITSLTNGLGDGGTFMVGTTTETYTVTDGADNTATCSLDITVNDNEAPAITCPVSGTQNVCAPVGGTYSHPDNSWDATSAADNCGGAVTLSYSLSGATSGSGTTLGNVAFNPGTTTVLWTASDVVGNPSTCSFDVNVREEVTIDTNPSDLTACLGDDITFSVVASGSPAPTYQWQKDGSDIPGETSADLILNSLDGSETGSYVVVASNDCGNVSSAPAQLTVNTPPVVVVQPASQTDCYGESVEFSVTAGGGDGSYTYQWQKYDGSNWNNISGATSDTYLVSNIGDINNPDQSQYRVVITDGCSQAVTSGEATLTVNQMVVQALVTEMICDGDAISFTVETSGVQPTAYEWQLDGTTISNGATYSGVDQKTLTISNATTAQAGTYSARAVFAITQPNNNGAGVLSCSGSFVDVGELVVDTNPPVAACKDITILLDATGKASITAADIDDGSYDDCSSVSLSADITNFNCHNIGANTVTLTVSDSNGNTDDCTSIVTVTEGGNTVAVNAGIAYAPIVCNGDLTTVTITTTSGIPPFEYTFNGITNETGIFTNLTAGNAIAWSVVDTFGCSTYSDNLDITEPELLSATIASTDVTCSSGADGSITITNSQGGSGSYEYSHDGGGSWQSSPAFLGLTPGVYNIQIRDANNPGCISILNDALEIYILSADIAVTNVTCFGASDGEINVTNADGGSGDFEFSIDGGSNWQSSGNFPNLGAGTFNVLIRDANEVSCIITLDAALDIAEPGELSANLDSTNILCFGGNDGTITISSASGGSGSYEYSIDGGLSWQSDGDFTALLPGDYDVHLRDANEILCEKVLNPLLTLVEASELNADIATTNVSCYGGNNGTIILSNPVGGSGVYEYTIDGGLNWQDNPNYISLTAGTYNVQIRDKNVPSCVKELDAALSLTEPAALVINDEPNNITECVGSLVTFNVNATNQVGTINYRWQRMRPSEGSFSDLVSATPGELQVANIGDTESPNGSQYRVIVSDDCSADTSVVVSLTVNEIISFSPAAQNTVLCEGEDTVFTVVTSGAVPTNYQWQINTTGSWIDIVDGPVVSGSISDKLVFTGATPAENGEYRVLVTFPTSAGTCEINSENVYERHLLVHPAPGVDDPGSLNYCEGINTPAIALTGSPSGVVFDITGGSAIGLFDRSGITEIPSYFAVAGNATITITPVANGCPGIPLDVEVTIDPMPGLQVEPFFQTICSGGTTNLKVGSNLADVRYHWTTTVNPAGSVVGASDASDTTLTILEQTLTNTTTSQATVTYSMHATKNGCPGPTIDIVVTVEPAITLSITDPPVVCEPGTVDLTDPSIVAGSSAGLNYEYYTDTLATTYVTDETSVGNGKYFIKAIDPSTSCYEIKPVNVIVSPTPAVVVNDPAPICAPGTIDITDPGITAGSDAGIIFTYWEDDVAATPLSDPTAVGDGTYYIRGENGDGCYNIQPVVVIVYTDVQTPVFVDGTTSNVCMGDGPRVYSASAVNSTNLTYEIDASSLAAGNSINSSTGEVTFASDYVGNITVTVTATGCTAPTTAVHTITVHELPDITLTASPLTICEGEAVDLTATVAATTVVQSYSANNTTDYNITNGVTTESPVAITADAGETISSNDVIIVTLNITHSYDADLDIYLIDPSGTVMDLSTDNGGSGNNYTGTVFRTDGTNSITSGSAPFNNTYKPEGNLSDLVGASISGEWNLRVLDDYPADDGVLLDWELEILHEMPAGTYETTFNGVGTSGTPISNNGTATEIIIPSAGTHNYTATTIDENGCVATSNQITVVVNDTPEAEIAADYCSVQGKVRLTAIGGASGASYDWRNASGDYFGNTEVILVDIVDLYNVTITNPNGCSDFAQLSVSNEFVVNGDFEAGNTGFTSGYGFRTPWVTPPNEATSSANSALWDEDYYGVGENGRYYHTNFWGRDHTSGSGNYMIVNGNRSAGTAIWEQTVVVQPNTNYYFSAWSMSLNSAGNDAVLQFEVNGELVGSQARLPAGQSNNSNNGWIRFYSDPTWNSGSVSGPITIRIRNVEPAANGNDFGLDDISFGTLDPLPLQIAVTVDDNCEGDTIKLYSNSQYGMEPITYTWTGPNAYSSSDQNPVIPVSTLASEGWYKLEAVDGYGCEIVPDSVYLTVNVAPTANAGDDDFTCTANPVVNLNGVVGGSASSGTWSGGDGVFSPNANTLDATYTFGSSDVTAGFVRLILSTDDPAGVCESVSDTMFVTIYNSLEVSTTSTIPTCHSWSDGTATATIDVESTPPYEYLWNDGQTTSTASNLTAGEYWVLVTDANGCTATDTVEVVEPAEFTITARSPIITPPSCYNANDGMAVMEVTGGTEPYVFIWDAAAGNQTTDTARNLSTGVYTVLVSDANGCSAATFTATIPNPPPPTLNCPGNVEDTLNTTACSIRFDDIEDPVHGGYCAYTLNYELSGATVGSGSGSVNNQVDFNIGQTWVKYIVEDVAGNKDSCEFMVWVKHIDYIAYSYSCPTSPVSADASAGSCEANVSLSAPTVTDPCNEVDTVYHTSTIGVEGDPSGNYPVGLTSFWWIIEDVSGNADSCLVEVIVNDTTPPTINCPAPAPETAGPNDCDKTFTQVTDPTYNDDCTSQAELLATLRWRMEGATTGNGTGTVTGETFNVGTTLVWYFIEDASGNSDSCSFDVSIVHIDIPSAAYSCPTPAVNVYDADPDGCEAFAALDTVQIFDPCNEIDSVWHDSPYSSDPTNASGYYPIDTTDFNWYVRSLSGVVEQCPVRVIVNDHLPVLTCPANVVEDADFGENYASNVTVGLPVFSDNCDSTLTYTITDPLGNITSGNTDPSGINLITGGNTYYVGVTTIEYTFTDGHSHSLPCSFTVTVQAAPEIGCIPDTTVYADNNCENIFDVGAPPFISGVPPINWTWTITEPDGNVITGSYVGNAPDPQVPDLGNFAFKPDTTYIQWIATNVSGADTCEHWVAVIDSTPPVFTTAPYEDCVDPLHWAIYDPANATPQFNHIDPNLNKSPSPDYRTMYAGDTFLDVLTLADNCCDSTDITINWRIEFSDTPHPITGVAVSHPNISGTGQPSTYVNSITGIPEDIYLWGDGVTFQAVTHTIFYWAEDCNGNTSAEQTETIVIDPRPRIIKQN